MACLHARHQHEAWPSPYEIKRDSGVDERYCYFLNTISTDIRMLIYEELLLFDETDPSKTIYPQILATCKTVFCEARPVMKKTEETTLVCTIDLELAGSNSAVRVRRGTAGPLIRLRRRDGYMQSMELREKGHDLCRGDFWEHLTWLDRRFGSHRKFQNTLSFGDSWKCAFQELSSCRLAVIELIVRGDATDSEKEHGGCVYEEYQKLRDFATHFRKQCYACGIKDVRLNMKSNTWNESHFRTATMVIHCFRAMGLPVRVLVGKHAFDYFQYSCIDAPGSSTKHLADTLRRHLRDGK